ncbi:putative membrane protein [Burkholderia cenocepacia]|uniref:Membrane protein n=1 Tax=Burkholderia cenocepacia TaxID=95486 RepID=A0AAN0S031_9BURK|nr:putative membrane protein [Burkholderia cenocepacia]
MTIERPNWELPASIQMQQNVAGAVLALLALAYIVYVCRKDRVIYPLFVYVGAGIAALHEPIVDFLGVSTFPEIHQTILYATFGRQMPPYLALCYLYYYPVAIVWLIRRMNRGMTATQWWISYAGLSLFTAAFDMWPIHVGLWRYYGPLQPWGILGFPAWWWFGQSSAIFTSAAIIHMLRRAVLSERRSVLLLAITPMLIFTALEGPALPITLALHTATEPSTTTPFEFVTIALHLMNVWLCGQIVTLRRSDRMPASDRYSSLSSN